MSFFDLNNNYRQKIFKQNPMDTTIEFINSIKYQKIFNGVIEVPFQISLEDFNKNIEESFSLTVFFYSPSNYTTVGATSSFDKGKDFFRFISHHDSCWRDAAKSEYNSFIDKVHNAMIEKHGEHYYKSFSVFKHHGYGIDFMQEYVLKVFENENGEKVVDYMKK